MHGRVLEAQQNQCGLDLGALSMCRFDLQRGRIVGQNAADLERTCFLVKNVYQINPRLNPEKRVKKCFPDRIAPWYALLRHLPVEGQVL